MKVSGSVAFASDRGKVYRHIAGSAYARALDDGAAREGAEVFMTRYETPIGPMTVATTEEVTLVRGENITWRHKDGPLAPNSWETFRFKDSGGGTVVHYEGEIEPRNPLLRGPLTALWVAPLTRRISLGSLEKAKAELDG